MANALLIDSVSVVGIVSEATPRPLNRDFERYVDVVQDNIERDRRRRNLMARIDDVRWPAFRDPPFPVHSILRGELPVDRDEQRGF